MQQLDCNSLQHKNILKLSVVNCNRTKENICIKLLSIRPKILCTRIFQDFLLWEDVNYFDGENVNAIGFRSCLIPFINNFEKQNYNQIVAWHAWLYVPLFSTLFHNPPLSFLYSVFQKMIYHENRRKALCIFDSFSESFSNTNT